MTGTLVDIVFLSVPLGLASFGALASEYAGRTAVFIDGIMNLSAFLCFLFGSFSGSAPAACILSVLCCTGFIFLCLFVSERAGANPFLASLALNIFSGALVSLLSASVFKTRGVLTSARFLFPAPETRLVTSCIAAVLIAAGIVFLFCTKRGLYLRITGNDADVLNSRGVSTSGCRMIAWCMAAFYASVSGCILTMRISSFVPGISGGRGWLALAAVFLGRRTCAGTIIAAIVMSAAEYFADNLQNVFPNISTPLLISLPYLTALILLFFTPADRRK